MYTPIIRRPDVIPRYSVPMVQRLNTVVENPDDPFAENNKGISFKKLVCKEVTLQPLTSYQMSVLPNGLSTKECYTLFSQNVMFPAIDNSNRLSDAIYIPSCLLNRNSSQVAMEGYEGGWFVVVKTKNFFTGVIPHSETVVVRDTSLTNNDGITQYPQPDIEAIASELDTTQSLRNVKWWNLWEINNEPSL